MVVACKMGKVTYEGLLVPVNFYPLSTLYRVSFTAYPIVWLRAPKPPVESSGVPEGSRGF